VKLLLDDNGGVTFPEALTIILVSFSRGAEAATLRRAVSRSIMWEKRNEEDLGTKGRGLARVPKRKGCFSAALTLRGRIGGYRRGWCYYIRDGILYRRSDYRRGIS